MQTRGWHVEDGVQFLLEQPLLCDTWCSSSSCCLNAFHPLPSYSVCASLPSCRNVPVCELCPHSVQVSQPLGPLSDEEAVRD